MISIQILVIRAHIPYGFETKEWSLEGNTDPYITDANLLRPSDTQILTATICTAVTLNPDI